MSTSETPSPVTALQFAAQAPKARRPAGGQRIEQFVQQAGDHVYGRRAARSHRTRRIPRPGRVRGQPDRVPVGFDTRGDGVGYLLVSMPDAGAVDHRIVAHWQSSACRSGCLAVFAFFRLVSLGGVHPEPERVNVAGGGQRRTGDPVWQ
jgi:hypothetical protein